MKTVVLYGFEGEFVGGNEYEYHHPELNQVHKCLLFLAQDSEHPDFEFATTECSKFGFANLNNLNELKFFAELDQTELEVSLIELRKVVNEFPVRVL